MPAICLFFLLLLLHIFSHMSKSCFSLKVNPQIQSPEESSLICSRNKWLSSWCFHFTSLILFVTSCLVLPWLPFYFSDWYRRRSLISWKLFEGRDTSYPVVPRSHSVPCPHERSVSICLWSGPSVPYAFTKWRLWTEKRHSVTTGGQDGIDNRSRNTREKSQLATPFTLFPLRCICE